MGGALAAVVLCAGLGGCAGAIESTYGTGFWVQPGKYDFVKCPDIARYTAADTAREKSLMNLMQHADEEMTGPLINVTVYQAQLEQVRAELRLLQRTGREKGCDSSPPPVENKPAAKKAKK